jgi:hypothetical protein
MTSIAEQIQALQSMTVAELAHRYEELHGTPPRVRNKAFLQRRVVWKIQERELGGLSERARARLDELVAEIDLPLAAPPPRAPRRAVEPGPKAPMLGTTLVRRWHDQELHVEVRDSGFEWNGTVYSSLSAVARAITGSNWNGRLFFGLTKRGGHR